MSITQTYFLAHKARAKLSSEAGRPDHNLRLLVGHANLLDTLMLELADAEREQESWFNQSVRVASPAPAAPKPAASDRHVQWADAIVEEEEPEEPEEPEEDWQADDSDMSSDASSDYSDEDEYDEDEDEIDEHNSASSPDYDDEDCEMVDAAPLRRVASHTLEAAPTTTTPTITVDEAEDDDSDVEVDDDEEDYAQLTLTRSPSHSATAAPPSPTSPPELVMEDSDASSKTSSAALATDRHHGHLQEERRGKNTTQDPCQQQSIRRQRSALPAATESGTVSVEHIGFLVSKKKEEDLHCHVVTNHFLSCSTS